ncbi:MAG: FlgB family protein [Paracoccaceae bacterium]
MFEQIDVIRMAQAMAAHAGQRQVAVSRNIANADTPGYKAVDTADFAAVYRDGEGLSLRQTRSGHRGASRAEDRAAFAEVSGNASPNGNTVSLETEMLRAADIRQQHDMALAIYRSSADILRASLGKAR